MEVSSYFPSDRHRKNLQLQEAVGRCNPTSSLVKGYSLQNNTPPSSVDSLPHRGARRSTNNQILELIDQKVAACKSCLVNGSAPPSRRFTSDTHSSTKVNSSRPSPSNADSEPTTSSVGKVERPRQSPRCQQLERPFSASMQLQEEEDFSDVLSEPQCSSAEKGSTSSRRSGSSRLVLDLNRAKIKENITGMNCESTVHPRLNPAADYPRQNQTKPIKVTPTVQRHSQIFLKAAVQSATLLCSKAAVVTFCPQNKPEGGICQNSVVQISVNPQDGDVSKLRKSPPPIVYEDISEDETEINLEKSPCPLELPDAKEYAGPCVVLDYDDVEDDDDDDDWEVFPLSILNITFQPSDKQTPLDDERNETALVSRPCEPSGNFFPASAFTQMKVFDTPDQQGEAVNFGKLPVTIHSVPEQSFVELEGRRETPESLSDLEDCYDTEDSSDYSSGPERSLIAVSLQHQKNPPSHASPESKSEKETKEKTSTPEKGWKTVRQNDRTLVIVLDSSDDSDDYMELTNHQPAPNQKDHSKMEANHDADEDKVSPVDLNGTKDYGQTARDDSIIILSDSDDDSSATLTSETTDRRSAASPCHNMTADRSSEFPEPGTVSEESVTKTSEIKRRSRSSATQRLGINSTDAEKCPQVEQAPPVKTAQKQQILPHLYIKKLPDGGLQLLQRPRTHRQAKDQPMSNPTPTTVTCKDDTANHRVTKSVLRSKPRPSSTASMVQKSVSSSASSRSKTSNSSKDRSSSSSVQPSNPAKSKVCSDWQNSYISIERKTRDQTERDLTTKASNLPAETRPQPSRVPRRRHTHESTPLMKKTKLRAIEFTRARKCSTPADPRYPVGDGYKWKNSTQHGSKTRVGRPRTRRSRSESPFDDSPF